MSDFAATRWTLVAQARGNDTEAKAALSELCDAYYKPVIAFLACEGRTQDAARELDVVEGELRDAGKAAHFVVLKPWLMGDGGDQSVADADVDEELRHLVAVLTG